MAGDILGEGASNEARTNALAFLRRGLEREQGFEGEVIDAPVQPSGESVAPSSEMLMSMLQAVASIVNRREAETQVVTRPDGTAARIPITQSPSQSSRAFRTPEGATRFTNLGPNPGDEEQFFEGSDEFAQQQALEQLIEILLGRGGG